jgi:hypothetical protein
MSGEIQIVQVADKQPYDQRPYTFYARPFMDMDGVINAVLGRVYEAGDDPEVTWDDTMLVSTAYVANEYKITVRVTGGTDGTTYRCRVRFTTAAGDKYEFEFEFLVTEVQ